METYEELVQSGKYEIELKHGECNILNSIDYFYTLTTQKRAFPILSVIYCLLTEDENDFNNCLVRLFIHKFHRLPPV